MLVMTDSRFPAAARVAAGLLTLLILAILSACASPSAQAGDPPAPQVTAARAVSRPVTEWNEFTGRLEAASGLPPDEIPASARMLEARA